MILLTLILLFAFFGVAFAITGAILKALYVLIIGLPLALICIVFGIIFVLP
ncbi:hypothetical protein P261_02803 [Lachnospiraceae bacterium TWA4]|nr:hypothetical protein P261_02803 [Lachnospiraceae bacterium TWA4]